MDVPERINPETWEIICRTKKVFRIEIRYQTSDIRRGNQPPVEKGVRPEWYLNFHKSFMLIVFCKSRASLGSVGRA